PTAREARARGSRLLARRLAGRLGGRRPVAVGLRHLALHLGHAVARPVSQRRVRALGGHGLVGRQRRLPFFLLLAGEAQTGQGPEARADVDVRDGADGLERLGRLREVPLLELRFADEEQALGLDALVVTLRGDGPERDGILPVLLLEGGGGQLARHLSRALILRELRAQLAPCRVLLRAHPEAGGDGGRLVVALRGGRILGHERLVGGEALAAIPV